MSGIVLQKVEIDGRTVQLFQDEASGKITGYSFSQDRYYDNPLEDNLPEDFKPTKMGMSEEEMKEKVREIWNYPTADLDDGLLRAETLKRFGIKVGLSEADGETPNTIHFPYRKKGKIIGYKSKLISPKKFWSVGPIKDSELFGWKEAVLSGSNKLYITEGECFEPSSEVLTRKGWVPLDEFKGEDVLQVLEDGSSEFVKPIAKVVKEYSGDMIHYESGSFKSTTTEGHKLVRVDNGGLTKVSSTSHIHLPIPRASQFSKDVDCDLTDIQIQTLVMFSADFSLREGGDIYGCFSKERKIERATELLDRLGVRYSSNLESSGMTNFYIRRGQGVLFQKEFDQSLILSMSRRQLVLFQKELVHWDGNSVPNRNQEEYSSKILGNATTVQTVCHLLGFTSTIIRRSNELGSWFKVSMLYGKSTSSTQKGYTRKEYSGTVMCVTVPSGMIMVRQDESISVSGNCDTAATYQMLKDKNAGTKWEDIEHAVISVPNGAGAAKSALMKQASTIKRKFDEVVLLFDMDGPGQKAAIEVAKVLPNVKIADMPLKDARECLIKGRQKAFCNSVIFKAEKPKNTRLLSIDSLFKKAREPIAHGYSYPWPRTTELTRGIHLGQTIYITAPEKVGKSELLNAIAVHCMEEHNLKCLLMKPEEDPAHTVKMLAGKIAGKFFNDPNIPFDYEAYDKATTKLAGKATILDVYQDLSWDTMQDDIRYAASEGTKIVFVDPLTAATTGLSASDANTKLQEIAQGLSTMSKDLGITIFIFTHTRNPKSGLAFNRGGHIEVGDITGGRAMGRSAHQVFALQSNQDPELSEDERNLRELVLLADRNIGAIGTTNLFWDKNTSLFNEV